MGSTNQFLDLPDQICYVQCGFCTTILLVSVPFSSMSMVVTVRCGHCTSLLSVNMMKASFFPLQLLASLHQDNLPKDDAQEMATNKKNLGGNSSLSLMASFSDNEEEDLVSASRIVNKPPEKRQRAPSAYNHFIKEEIRRLKALYPNIAHKEAFSQAAKNWAHFPLNQNKDGDIGESCLGQGEEKTARINTDLSEVHGEGEGFRERKVARNSIWEKTPFY